MVNWLSGLLYGATGLVCTCMVLLVTFQEKLVYVPVIPGMSKGYPITPARLDLEYEDVELHAADGVRLHSWFIKGSAQGAFSPDLQQIHQFCFNFMPRASAQKLCVCIWHICLANRPTP